MIEITPDTIPKTGDDTPAGSIWGYVRRMTGWRQAGLACLALLVTALNLAPVELQRRIVDDAIATGDVERLLGLGALYAGVLLALQVTKLVLRTLQAWLTESAALYTRRHLLRLYRSGQAGRTDRPGEAVAVVGNEVEKLAGFVGSAPSNAVADAAMLLGVVGYMMAVDMPVALVAVALILPQVFVTPLLQRRLNRLVERRLALMREFGNAIADGTDDDTLQTDLRTIYRNRIAFGVYKALMKALLNLLNAAGPLALLVAGGWQVLQGETTIGVLVAFLSGFQRLSDPIRELIAFYRECAQAEVQHAMVARWM